MLWSLLPYADQGLKSKSSLLQGRFTGDPAFEYEHSVTHRVGEGDSAQEQTTAVSHHRTFRFIHIHASPSQCYCTCSLISVYLKMRVCSVMGPQVCVLCS